MAPLPIVEHLDVFEDILLGFVSCGIVPMVHEFTFERPEEAFDAGVVPAVAFAAHAGRDAMRSRKLGSDLVLCMRHRMGIGKSV